jgi:glyoxylase-like metal-dependent hydrolase (beta-lactamase superfamily II)
MPVAVFPMAIPTPFRIGTVNAYLVDDDPLTLIDTGPNWPASLRALEQSIEKLGHRVDDIGLVLLTHQHNDHVGLAGIVKERSGAQVSALEHVAEHLRVYEESMVAEEEFARAVMERYGIRGEDIATISKQSRARRQYGGAVEVDRSLRPGDRIELDRCRMDVIWRPGHSPGDTVFALEDRTAIVGDHVLKRISSNPVIHRPLSHSRDPADRDPALVMYIESLERTLEDGFSELMGGHGGTVTEPAALIEERLGHHGIRKDKILELVRDGKRHAGQLIAGLWGDLDDSQIWLALSEVLGHTDLLVAAGLLVETERNGVTSFEVL